MENIMENRMETSMENRMETSVDKRSINAKIRVSVVMASSRVGGEAVASLIQTFYDKVSIRAVFRSEEKAQTFSKSMKDTMNVDVSNVSNVSNVDDEINISNNVADVDEKVKFSEVLKVEDETNFPNNVSDIDENTKFSEASNDKKAKNIEISIGLDAMDPSTHSLAFSNIEKAFIIAPQSENRSDIVNSLLSGASFFGVKHVVLIGGVFQEEEKFLFHKQWMKSRRHSENLGLQWTQLECSDFMENVFRNRDNIRFKKRFIGVGKEGLSLPVSLKDVGIAAASILSCSDERHKNRGYRIVGPELLSLSNVVDLFSKKLGFSVELVDSGVEEAREAATKSGIMPKWQSEGFYDWIELYYLTNRFKSVKSDLPLLGITPTFFDDWLQERISQFQ